MHFVPLGNVRAHRDVSLDITIAPILCAVANGVKDSAQWGLSGGESTSSAMIAAMSAAQAASALRSISR